MANVYGSEVTEMTVRELPGYDKPEKTITRFDVAKVALDMENSENKVERARAYLNELKDKLGYNATGVPVTYVRDYDWHGRVGESAFPTEIKNGQWGVFFHEKPPGTAVGSEGAVVYRLKGVDDEAVDNNPEVDCCISWSIPWGPWYNNHCYAEIRERDHFDDTVWGVVERKMLNDAGTYWEEKHGRLVAELTMGKSSTSELKAVLKLA